MNLRGKTWILAFLQIIFMSVSSISTCHHSEYQTGSQCCPLCSPGHRVKADCTDFTSTSCVSCTEGTFMNLSNGLKRCHQCSICDPGSGLKEASPCEPSSDTVCEPVDGFFCISSTSGSCSAAQRHRSCEAGQHISRPGTSSSDSECSACSNGTFSNGSLASCQPHTRCETLNLQLIKAGTNSTDAECGEKSSNVFGIVINAVLFALILLVASLFSVVAGIETLNELPEKKGKI